MKKQTLNRLPLQILAVSLFTGSLAWGQVQCASVVTDPSPAAAASQQQLEFQFLVAGQADPMAAWKAGGPLNDRGAYQPITFSDQVLLPGAIEHHVLHGDFKMMTLAGTTTQVPGLVGGMHTPRALARFLVMRPDMATFVDKIKKGLQADVNSQDYKEAHKAYRTASNGVVRISFPPEAGEVFHAGGAHNAQPIVKTFYPETWSDEKVIQAIDEATRSGVQDKQDPSKYAAIVDGVAITLVIDVVNGVRTVRTCYPSGDQTPATGPAPGSGNLSQQPAGAPQQSPAH